MWAAACYCRHRMAVVRLLGSGGAAKAEEIAYRLPESQRVFAAPCKAKSGGDIESGGDKAHLEVVMPCALLYRSTLEEMQPDLLPTLVLIYCGMYYSCFRA